MKTVWVMPLNNWFDFINNCCNNFDVIPIDED